ncbi:MAG: hypothetical protein SVR04_15130 [Spirochaetota bacterium]|nr:hypothetical protein [Spirochaetota bacterium]
MKLKGTEIATTNIATSAINSLDFNAMFSGGDWFDKRAFGKGAFGTSAFASVTSGMAGNFVTQGLGKWNLETKSGTKFTGWSGAVDVNSIQAFNSTL